MNNSKKKDEYKKNNLKIKKNFQTKGENNKELLIKFKKECEYIKKIIIKSISTIDNKIILSLFSDTDSDIAITCLNGLFEKIEKLNASKNFTNNLINELQVIIDDLTTIICGFGTKNVDDLIYISTGKYINQLISNSKDVLIADKLKIICENIEPMGYKTINWKENFKLNDDNNICVDKSGENIISIEQSNNLECFIIDNTKSFSHKVYGIKFIIQNITNKCTIIITGLIKNLPINLFLDNKYIKKQYDEIVGYKKNMTEYQNILQNIIDSLTLKDLLIYSKNDIIKRVFCIKNEVNMINQKKIRCSNKRILR